MQTCADTDVHPETLVVYDAIQCPACRIHGDSSDRDVVTLATVDALALIGQARDVLAAAMAGKAKAAEEAAEEPNGHTVVMVTRPGPVEPEAPRPTPGEIKAECAEMERHMLVADINTIREGDSRHPSAGQNVQTWRGGLASATIYRDALAATDWGMAAVDEPEEATSEPAQGAPPAEEPPMPTDEDSDACPF
jgi:hypothetical protein